MITHIIKINSTGKKDLTFNDIPIRAAKKNLHQSPPDITLGYISCIFPYIKDIAIVYISNKFNNKKFTIKRLEFYCDNEIELNDEEFINFVEVLNRLGFYSENDVKISYCKIDKYIDDNNVMREKHEEILAYTFTSLVNRKPKRKQIENKKPNRSNYFTKKLDICKNLIV